MATLGNGYETKTTFYKDFTIAEAFGDEAIKDTFKRAFNEWKDNTEYATELCLIMNLKCWEWYGKKNQERAQLYSDYYYQVRAYCLDNYKGKDFEYFWRVID